MYTNTAVEMYGMYTNTVVEMYGSTTVMCTVDCYAPLNPDILTLVVRTTAMVQYAHQRYRMNFFNT